MTTDDKLAAILAAIQTDPGNRGLARDPADNLFTACPGDFAAACRAVADDPGSGVALLTGFYIPTATPPASETDGPLGTVLLAAALADLGYRPVVVTDVSIERPVQIGLKHRRATDVLVLTVPPPAHPWHVFTHLDWASILTRYDIRHTIAVEVAGPSRQDGRCYSMRGRDLTAHAAPLHHLIDECRRRRPPVHTVGIGDGGNEIGMGNVAWATVARNITDGVGIACRVQTDHLIACGVSNWGAYALAAGVYVLHRIKPPAGLFDSDREVAILADMVRDGPLVDGVTGQQTATVDGLTWDEYARPLTRIRDILESA